MTKRRGLVTAGLGFIHLHSETDIGAAADLVGEQRHEGPLVSVGIPTFNRASLLDLRLGNVLSQSYRNLEIIVSDNASPGPDVQAVIQRWSALDSRVRSYRQAENIGAYNNFLFVMEKATGPYFTWASDDDEWDVDFIAATLSGIGNAQLFMPRMATHFMTTGRIHEVEVPTLGPNASRFDNAVRFLANIQPGLLYGLHELDSLRRGMPDRAFDLADALMVYRAVLDKGVTTGAGAQYRAGVPEDVYKIKPFGRPGSADKLSYRSFFIGCVQTTLSCEGLSLPEKFRLIPVIVNSTISVVDHLTRAYPEVARPQHSLLSSLLTSVEMAKNVLRRVRHSR